MSIRQTEMKITALYERLSCDDDLDGDSNSIINQKKYLEDYAEKQGFLNCVHYTDDGYSGGNFNRPAWKQLIDDVNAGKIGVVLAKDMSRIGRNYVQTGYFTEFFFPENGVRFIAVGNNIDSNDQNSSQFAPFLNVFNEFLLRDLSRKQIASYQTRSQAGQSISNGVIYGYKKDPDQKHHWLIDEEAAQVIRHIFELAAAGNGTGIIANILRKEKVERPAVYWAKQGIGIRKNTIDMSRPYDWSAASVARILKYKEYMGHSVNFKTHIQSYKTKKAIRVPEEERVIIKNTHEPIVEPELWEMAQKARKTKHRTDKTGIPNPLTGLVFCADCGKKMYNHRGKLKPDLPNNGIDPDTGLLPGDNYDCSTYNLTHTWEEKKCATHRIPTKALFYLVLETIRLTSKYALGNQEEFKRKVMEAAEIQRSQEAKNLKKEIAKAKKRSTELDVLIKKLYESYALGKIPESRFDSLLTDYEKEQEMVNAQAEAGQTKLDAYLADQERADSFLELARKYTDFSVLTPQMIYEFVDKIEVHRAEKENGERSMRVDIYLKYIGNFPIPLESENPNSLSEPEDDPKRRAYFREYKQKKKAEKAATVQLNGIGA